MAKPAIHGKYNNSCWQFPPFLCNTCCWYISHKSIASIETYGFKLHLTLNLLQAPTCKCCNSLVVRMPFNSQVLIVGKINFMFHLQEKLFPGVFIHWKKYQQGLINEVKSRGDLVIAGDGRHDSMGHSAKYCAYTVFCCTVPFIIHFALVQVC